MPNTTTQNLDFLQRCTAIKLERSNIGKSKKLPKTAVSTESDANRVKATKTLWDCQEAAAIDKELNRVRATVVKMALPSPFGSGIYFVPNTLLAEVDAELETSSTITLPALTQSLIDAYDRILAAEAAALGPNFNPLDYPTPDAIRSKIKIDYFYTVFGIPESLPNAMYAREQAKAQSRLAEAVDTMQQVLRAEMNGLLRHAIASLTAVDAKTGKPKKFHNTVTGNIREFLRLFKDRNITDDAELESVCNQVNQILDGVDPEDLRKQEPLRESTVAAFQQIKTTLDAMMVPRGSRMITFEEDDAEGIETAA